MARRFLVTAAGTLIVAGDHPINTDVGEPPNPLPPYPLKRWFVSPDGDAGNDGGRTTPWTIEYAFAGAGGVIQPSDTIKVLPGVYSLPGGIELDLGGIADWPLVIDFAADVELDFSFEAFRLSPATAWVPVTVNGTQMYRSAITYPQAAFGRISGTVEIGDRRYLLAPHGELDALSAASSVFHATDPYYVGPGLCHHSDDYIYFRGDPLPPATLGVHIAAELPFTDPRNLVIRLSTGQSMGLTFNAPHVSLVGGAELTGAWSLLFTNGQDDITFDGLAFQALYFVARLGGSDSVTFIDCYANGGLWQDSWIDRASVKDGDTIADGARTCGLDVEAATNVMVDPDCLFENFFDGILGAPNGLVMQGTWRILDDAFQMKYNVANIQIGGDPDNITVFEGAGPSRDGAEAANPNPDPGTVYLGFCTFDGTKRPVWWGRTGFSEVGIRHPIALPTHGQPSGADYAWMWNMYYCTVVIGELSTASYVNAGAYGQTGNYESQHTVYNCIFHMDGVPTTGLSVNGLGNVFRSYGGMEDYDGNVYSHWLASRSIFRQVQTSTGTISASNGLSDLVELYASQAYTDSLVYSDGWETHGLYVADVQLDEDYVPSEPLTQTGAVDLTATGWPGTSVYKARRGAL